MKSKEIKGAKAIEKLIESVSGAIGKVYEPRNIRKTAEATAYEIELISESMRKNSDIPMVYDKQGVLIDTRNYKEIEKRAFNRLAYQEIKKQQNIEAVIDNAYEELENIETEDVSSKLVDQDWILHFFNNIENVSNEDIQKIWGHILAGEIKSPNTYSFRTLEKLKNMTQQEIEHFQVVSSLSLQSNKKKFVLSDKDILNKYGVSFSHILELEECGLMVAQELTLEMTISNEKKGHIYNSDLIGIISNEEEEKELKLYIYTFTESGSQLITAIQPKFEPQYIVECMKKIKDDYKDFNVTLHKIDYLDEELNVRYNTKDILQLY